MKLIETVFALMQEKRFQKKEFAEALGVHPSAITSLEKGTREIKTSELEKIASILGVRVIDLFTYPDVYKKKTVNYTLTDPPPHFGKPVNEENPYKLLYELQKENTDLKVECERLKNAYAPTKSAKVG